MAKKCVLYDRDCVECGECLHCELDPTKLCDNCGKCIKNDAEYAGILIDQIVKEGDEIFLADDPDFS